MSASTLGAMAVELAREITMPEQVVNHLEHITENMAHARHGDEVLHQLSRLSDRATSQEAVQRLHVLLPADDQGFAMLWCMLCAAARSRGEYRRRGISPMIFTDTMSCFTRFVQEHCRSYGEYGFDREWWVVRQLGLSLFRLGELEFEFASDPQDVPAQAGSARSINVHIPSDARLDQGHCMDSIEQLAQFTEHHFPQWNGSPIMCVSWLLSPALRQLLPGGSHIVQFQKMFTLLGVQPQSEDWREWVFHRNPAPVVQLPETTSLQRTMKSWLLSGGTVGVGVGRFSGHQTVQRS